MSRPAEAIGAAVHASAIAVHRMIESDVGTVVTADDRARFGLFKDFDLRGGGVTHPFHGMRPPGHSCMFDGTPLCNPGLSIRPRQTGWRALWCREGGCPHC